MAFWRRAKLKRKPLPLRRVSEGLIICALVTSLTCLNDIADQNCLATRCMSGKIPSFSIGACFGYCMRLHNP